jgi:hypothetical protein
MTKCHEAHLSFVDIKARMTDVAIQIHALSTYLFASIIILENVR